MRFVAFGVIFPSMPNGNSSWFNFLAQELRKLHFGGAPNLHNQQGRHHEFALLDAEFREAYSSTFLSIICYKQEVWLRLLAEHRTFVDGGRHLGDHLPRFPIRRRSGRLATPPVASISPPYDTF
jgi:hypothetical protein